MNLLTILTNNDIVIFVLITKGFVMTHNELWSGICNLAKEFNVSCSGLARSAGLDPTVFNISKRFTKNGQTRWLSMYTLSRVLDATGITLAEFATMLPSDTHEKPKCTYLIRNNNNTKPMRKLRQ